MNDFPLLGNPGEAVPTVDVADLIAVWNVGQEVRPPHPGQAVGVDIEIYKSVCQPGADVRAICFRLMMIHALGMMGREEFAHLDQNEQFRNAVFKVAAWIPMTWVATGPMSGLPFDSKAFLREVQKEAKG